MDSSLLVRKMLQGSKNINHMRTEIDEFIGLMIECLRSFEPKDDNKEKVVKLFGLGPQWLLEFYPPNPSAARITFWQEAAGTSTMIYSSRSEDVTLHLKHIGCTRSHLFMLVEGLLETFPCLEEMWKPIIVASGEIYSR